MRIHYIFHPFFTRYFHIIFYQSHGHLKNHPCFLKQERNYIRMEICSTAFLTIAVVLTNKHRTKNSLLWQNIGDIGVRILQKLNVPWHQDSKTEKPQHRDSKTKIPQHWDSKTKKPQHRVSAEFWPLHLLILRSVPQPLKLLNKHFPSA